MVDPKGLSPSAGVDGAVVESAVAHAEHDMIVMVLVPVAALVEPSRECAS